MNMQAAYAEADRICNERNVWNRTIPDLAVYNQGGANLGRCYNAYYYLVESKSKLTAAAIVGLRTAGVLGFGQEFRISTDEFVRYVMFQPSGVDPRSDKPYPAQALTLYCYRFESRVDSSD